MAKLEVPIQVNLPDDWVEQIIDRLRNDPDADWAEVVRCKNCAFADWYTPSYCYCLKHGSGGHMEHDYCSYGEREQDG